MSMIDNSCSGNILDTISNLLTLVVGIINLIFVIKVYFKDKKDEKRRLSYEKKLNRIKQEKEYKYSWYEMINVSERINSLDKLSVMVKDVYNEINNYECDSLDDRKKFMAKRLFSIDTLLVSEKNKFSHILKSFDVNENSELSKLYNKFQDLYMFLLTKAVLKEQGDFCDLQICFSEIVQKYYSLGHDILFNNKQ